MNKLEKREWLKKITGKEPKNVEKEFVEIAVPYFEKMFSLLKRYKNESAVGLSKQLKEEGLNVGNGQLSKWIEILGGKKHSISDSNLLESTKEKMKSTFQKNYGADNPLCKGTSAFEKRNKTIKDKYGVENIFQSKEVIKDIAEKKEKTVLKKYGVKNVFELQSTKDKSRATCNKKYGTDYAIQNNDIKSKVAHKNVGRYKSKLEEKIESFLISENINFETQVSDKFKWVDNGKHHFSIPDFVIEESKLCIEVMGDYWHANPNKYLPDDIVYTRTAKEIWKFDNYKAAKRKELFGYSTLFLWEEDINNNFEKVCEAILNEIRQNSINKEN